MKLKFYIKSQDTGRSDFLVQILGEPALLKSVRGRATLQKQRPLACRPWYFRELCPMPTILCV